MPGGRVVAGSHPITPIRPLRRRSDDEAADPEATGSTVLHRLRLAGNGRGPDSAHRDAFRTSRHPAAGVHAIAIACQEAHDLVPSPRSPRPPLHDVDPPLRGARRSAPRTGSPAPPRTRATGGSSSASPRTGTWSRSPPTCWASRPRSRPPGSWGSARWCSPTFASTTSAACTRGASSSSPAGVGRKRWV